MFSIIISEKGGAERRESFDKGEVNIGRVQGNDLTLPKGNVSKQHARLQLRDGRFIVTDLKSTNGTYVNGRKIAQPTLVREGDKIYIGDFVLRIEAAAAAPAQAEIAPVDVPAGLPPAPAGSVGLARPVNATLKAPTHPPGAPLPRSQPSNVTHAPSPLQPQPPAASLAGSSDEVARPRAPSMPPPLPPAAQGGIRPTTLPLNQQMIAPPVQRPAPAAPPAAQRPVEAPAFSPSPSFPSAGASPSARAPAVGAVPAPAPSAPSAPGNTSAPTAVPSPAPAAAVTAGPAPALAARPNLLIPAPAKSSPSPVASVLKPAPAPAVPPPAVLAPAAPSPPVSARVPAKEAPHQAARRLAMTMLMGRVSDAVDLALLRANPIVEGAFALELERVTKAQAKAMRDEGEAPVDVDIDQLARDAHRELTALGAFAPLLEDDDVVEIHCVRFDQVLTVRQSGGEGLGVEPLAFTSDQALRRVVARLAHQSGNAWAEGETMIERRLPRASFVAVASPALAITIRKRRKVESSFDELTRAGTLSRAMAQFLESCVLARANVLVAGDGALSLVAALASSGPSAERIAIVQDAEDVVVPGAHVVSLVAAVDQSPADVVAAGAKLRPQRLVVSNLSGDAALATIDAVTSGTNGVLAAAHAPTLRHALARIVSQVIVRRSALDLDTTREILADTFDVVVEVTASAGGPRVTRISELGSESGKGFVMRDLFVWSTDGSGEGAFAATGTVPRIAADLAVKGAKLDPTMFKRVAR